jgi:hypothetical protein
MLATAWEQSLPVEVKRKTTFSSENYLSKKTCKNTGDEWLNGQT